MGGPWQEQRRGCADHVLQPPNSFQSSIGLYETGQTYSGKHRRSLRLQGLEPGFNDNSMSRAIVMHAAAYADPKVVRVSGAWGAARAARPFVNSTAS